MKFSDLPPCSCFVVISYGPSLLLVKDSEGNVRMHSSYVKVPEIMGDTEVQAVMLKSPGG